MQSQTKTGLETGSRIASNILTPAPTKADGAMLDLIAFNLASLGCPVPRASETASHFSETMQAFFLQHRARSAGASHSPIDNRIQDFLNRYYADAKGGIPLLPMETFILDRPGLARILSIPSEKDEFGSNIVLSYRVKQGVLHNPKSDRRTTKGSFHIAEGGLLIPDDKISVPRDVAARLFCLAFSAPSELLRLPFTSDQKRQAECWVSLHLRPLVCPEVKGFTPEKRMEIRFFAPGNLVGNLDFVESIFGNAGNPHLPENDAALDVEHWTGHTGCVILAPHLISVTKASLGLPRWDDATERQRRDGLCWKERNEPYNEGNAFKLTCRDESGVMVTLIADNYFGYCKKEVKTQISFAANLSGLYEEEHAGGALVFPSYDLGVEFSGSRHVKGRGYNYKEMLRLLGDAAEPHPEGYAVDCKFREIIYVPEKAHFDLYQQKVSWPHDDQARSIRLLPGTTYVRPSGYRVEMIKPPGERNWRLVGTVGEGIFCHKPCTVSGGGKSEISKPISDAIIQGPVFISDFRRDFEHVQELLDFDYSRRFQDASIVDPRTLLSPQRSLGSVIKLLTVGDEYTDEYNNWLNSIPQHIKELVFVVKRYYKPEWKKNWREHFSVDLINGVPGNELKLHNRKLITNYLRVGYDQDHSWRVFGLRKDFYPAAKLQREDDISVSVVVPRENLENLEAGDHSRSLKFIENCEFRLFQRPDDAIHPGYDKITERDLSSPGNFLSNFEPLTPGDARDILEDSIQFEQFTSPMKEFIRDVNGSGGPSYFVCSARPRIVDGKPSKNPRYLQTRPDLLDLKGVHLAQITTRLARRVPVQESAPVPVTSVLPGRRNNPPEKGIRSLAVYNPIHYMELPELFMEFICSVTGKSPSTTGAGSEGAMTKGPFNALLPIYDLNNALVAFAMTEADAFVTAAGYVGPRFRVDHDVSLLIPEVFSRMSREERDPIYLIEHGYLERVCDLVHNGEQVLASRLGWRMTKRFVVHFFGRIFNHPHSVFTEEMLKPEMQAIDVFVDGMKNITEAHRNISEAYFRDGCFEAACPPLQALLSIMKDGAWDGRGLMDAEFRKLFTRESIAESDWYQERLRLQQEKHKDIWRRHVEHLKVKKEAVTTDVPTPFMSVLSERLKFAENQLREVSSSNYLKCLNGTIGAQPMGMATATRSSGPRKVKKEVGVNRG
jgi:phosphoenolpyruvate carboxykinase (diphosphate)